MESKLFIEQAWLESHQITDVDRFQFYRPLFQLNIKGLEDINNFAKKVGCSKVSIYNYLAGKIPNLSVCKNLVFEGLKILDEKGIQYDKYPDNEE